MRLDLVRSSSVQAVSRLLLNPGRTAVVAGGPGRDPLQLLHGRLPGYAPSPLLQVPELAEAWGVGEVLLKAETDRLGLPSFKVLGASWAVWTTLLESAGQPADTPFSPDLLPRLRSTGVRRLVTATDGNHGRAVARVARTFGLDARVVVPAGAEQVRIDAIAAEGAEVEVADGDYDRAVALAAAQADADPGALLVQDTWCAGHEVVPQRIVEGYSTLFHEIDDATSDVDLLLVPVGVGSLAAAAVAHTGPRATRVVAVEPVDAPCVLASLVAGELVTSSGAPGTVMAGLDCATPSALAWPVLARRLDGAVAVTDDEACVAMRRLHDLGVDAGATGAAAVAGASVLLSDAGARAALAVHEGSRVVVLVTEGVTDPTHFAAVIGA